MEITIDLNAEEQRELRRFLNHPDCVIGCTRLGNDIRREVLDSLERKGFIARVSQKPEFDYYQLKLEA